MEYENRIVVFIDILGFKEIINKTDSEDEIKNRENIDNIILAYKTISENWTYKYKDDSKMVTIFSDSIVVSFRKDEKSEVFLTLLEIQWLIMNLLKLNIVCRGAVAYGKLLHTNEFLFGPALNEAYLLESKAALYPRIILDRSILEIGAKNSGYNSEEMEKEYIESLLELDLDGMYFIDYFISARSELDDPEYEYPEYIMTLRNIIECGLDNSKHPRRADVRIKYAWMREKFNKMVELITDEETINHYYENEEGLWKFYSNLNKL